MRERERERERESRHKQIYTGSSHNKGVAKFPCTSKGFHYNLTRLQLLKDSSKRLPNAQAHLQETSNVQGYYQENSTT